MTPTIVDHDRPADDRLVAAVAALPDAVSQNNDGWRPGAVILGNEIPPEHRLFAEYVKCVGRHEGARIPIGRLARLGDVHRGPAVGGECDGLRDAPILEIQKRCAQLATGGIDRADRHHSMWIGHRQAAQRHSVDDGENRVGAADAHCEREDDDDRESALFHEQPGGKPHVAKKVVHRPLHVRDAP